MKKTLDMKKTLAAGIGVAAFLAIAPNTFAQDTIMDATPDAVPERGAGIDGTGASAAGPRFNEGIEDNLPGRAAPPMRRGRSTYVAPEADAN
jgi:hypothetical protein